MIALIVLLALAGRYIPVDANAIARLLERIPLFYSGAAYVVAYVVITFFVFFAKDIFWVVGALLFGAALSTVLICAAEACNAGILFFLSRRFGRGYVDVSLSVRHKRLDQRLSGAGFGWLFMLRAAPLIPYRFLDLSAGLTGMRFSRYLAAVVLGTPVRAFWIQSILAGVGMAVLTDPLSIPAYVQYHPELFWLSLCYTIGVVAVMRRLNTR